MHKIIGVILVVMGSVFYLVLPGAALYYTQLLVFGQCVITRAQFGSRNQGFYYHYLTKFGFRPNKKYLNLILDYLIPLGMILGALIYQNVLF